MSSIRNILILESPYEEEINEYYNFLENNVPEFFSMVRNQRYVVNHLQIRSTINKGRKDFVGAKHRKLWLDLKDVINRKQHNSKYKNLHMSEIMLQIHQSSNGSYQRMMNLIKKTIDELEVSDYQFNIVKYDRLEKFKSGGSFF